MRLESAHIINFKLLKDVSLSFSRDASRPLTVVRAENGSGKTSILHALRWAMYGDEGIPPGMRLTSTASVPGQVVQVQVRVEFTNSDPYSGDEVQYRLIRTCEETPLEGDEYSRTPDKLRLLRLTDRGEEETQAGTKGEIEALLPPKLADVFFTNGDDVQRFIAGGLLAERERQEAVHNAVRQLLGFDDLQSAESRLRGIERKIRKELTSGGGENLKNAQEDLYGLDERIEKAEANRQNTSYRISAVEEEVRLDERELDNIKGIGDLESIQIRLHSLEQDIGHLEQQEVDIRREMRELLASEGLSRSFIGDRLDAGLDSLNGLANLHVIPGHSVEVLTDRLQLGVCICGEELCPGQSRYLHICDLIDEQRSIAPRIQRLTALWHEARNSQNAARSTNSDGRSVIKQAKALQDRYTKCLDIQRRKNSDLELEKKRREHIEVARIQLLTRRIRSNRTKLSEYQREVGEVDGRLEGLKETRLLCAARVQKAEKQATLNNTLRRRSTVAGDLLSVTKGTLAQMKSNHVQRVSARMNDLFLDIVGADPESDANVFTAVKINDVNYDIVIHSLEGRTLDADTELNGASQRALTLSFIWALMEVAEREAPRIIDTPLGMTSGAIKYRMVEILSEPVGARGIPYQVILFMTRSEIRDIEFLITKRAGVTITLTCSTDYPRDLVNDWGDGTPIVSVCSCNHREICSVCERRQDTLSSRFTRRIEE